MTPTFYYFFIIFLTCYISVPSFIYNLCWVLLLWNHLKLKYHYSKPIKLQNFLIIKNTAPIRLGSHLHPCERGRVQNGALSTLWVQKLSFVHFAPSADAVFAKGAQQEVMGMRRSWLWVKLPQNQWKTHVQRYPAMPVFWRGYLKKVVFSLLPSEYRTRAPSVRTPILVWWYSFLLICVVKF